MHPATQKISISKQKVHGFISRTVGEPVAGLAIRAIQRIPHSVFGRDGAAARGSRAIVREVHRAVRTLVRFVAGVRPCRPRR